MPGPFEYFIWLSCTFLEIAVVVCALKKGTIRKYFLLNLYMATSVIVTAARFRVLTSHGFTSSEYIYLYYYSDALLTIFLYLALSSLYTHVFSELKAERYVRFGTLLLLAGTALFSYGVVHESTTKLISRFVVLTYVLWAAILKLRETRTQLIQIVLSLGVYFSLFAADYALRNLYPSVSSLFISLLQVFGCFLPLAWAYTFWRIPEDARIVPSRLAVVPR